MATRDVPLKMQNIPLRTELGREIRDAMFRNGQGRIFSEVNFAQVEMQVMQHLLEQGRK